ncbi:MAG: NfeD family protein [Thermoplasmata archaeon]
MVDDTIGIILLVAGVILLAAELIHPGALLLIPASLLIMAGFLWIFLPNTLLNSDLGVVLIIVAAGAGALLEIPYYRWVAPVHAPMSTTVGTLVGHEGVIVAPVYPDSLHGKVQIGSEIWSARANIPIAPGTHVRVVAGSGVSVSVEPLPEGSEPHGTPSDADRNG